MGSNPTGATRTDQSLAKRPARRTTSLRFCRSKSAFARPGVSVPMCGFVKASPQDHSAFVASQGRLVSFSDRIPCISPIARKDNANVPSPATGGPGVAHDGSDRLRGPRRSPAHLRTSSRASLHAAQAAGTAGRFQSRPSNRVRDALSLQSPSMTGVSPDDPGLRKSRISRLFCACSVALGSAN